MLRGRIRTSNWCGVCSHGMRKCVPSPLMTCCERTGDRGHPEWRETSAAAARAVPSASPPRRDAA
eukprot:5520739-Prymnesium_polylepis.1